LRAPDTQDPASWAVGLGFVDGTVARAERPAQGSDGDNTLAVSSAFSGDGTNSPFSFAGERRLSFHGSCLFVASPDDHLVVALDGLDTAPQIGVAFIEDGVEVRDTLGMGEDVVWFADGGRFYSTDVRFDDCLGGSAPTLLGPARAVGDLRMVIPREDGSAFALEENGRLWSVP
jgi:hypothetical protein